MRTFFIILVALSGLAHPAFSQQRWGLAGEIGMASYSGHAASIDDAPEASGHPSGLRTWGLRVDRNGERVRFGIGIAIASTGIEFENEDASAEVKNLLNLVEISPEVSVVVFRPREAALRLHLGGVIERWSPEGDDSRTSIGGMGAISVELPFSSQVGVQVRWQMARTGSMFDGDDLPPEFERESGNSRRWIVGVRVGL